MRLGTYGALSPDRSMEIILESIGELVDYELAVVLGYDGREHLRVKKTMGPLSGPSLDSYSIALGERPDIAAILEGGRPRLFARDEEHIDTYAGVLDLPDGHSCLVAPLVADGQAIGLLTLDHRSCGVFSKEILRFIEVISRLIALSLSQAERARELKEENALLAAERNNLLGRDDAAFRSLAGAAPTWLAALDALRLVAATDSPVLLLGETGTGKEEAARAVHRLSPRARGPFVAVNCSAMPAALAESELFGHEKGSFTDARAQRKGRFELASGGTLFLDELGDLPPEIQPKLLRALQEGRFERVGGEKPVEVDVRVVAATHVDLAGAVAAGRFREDLYYRIAVFPVRLPPLRERPGDATILAELFASRLRERPSWEGLRFSSSALDYLESAPWPGNVRELRNAVERASILARGGIIGEAELRPGDGAPLLPVRPGEAGNASVRPGRDGAGALRLDDVLQVEERRLVAAALERSGGRVYGRTGAAAALGLKPSTLQGRMRRLGLCADGPREAAP